SSTPAGSSGTRIHRRDRPDTLSSNNLSALADLASEVEARRSRIARAIADCDRLMGRSTLAPRRHAAGEAAPADLERTKTELNRLLEASTIDLHFALSDEARSAYLKMLDAFRLIADAKGVWHAVPSGGRRRGSRPDAPSSLIL